jgi:hypothetical protein
MDMCTTSALQFAVELVEAVMSMHCRAKAKVKYCDDQFTNFISVGVFQRDTLGG